MGHCRSRGLLLVRLFDRPHPEQRAGFWAMSTETITSTTPAAPARSRSSAAASYKVRNFVVAFGIVGTVAYVLCDLLGLPLFTFHPATYRLEWGYALPRRNEGPVMYWYGWALTTLLASTAVGFLATLLPEKLGRKIPLFLLWALPLAAVPILFWTLDRKSTRL